MGTGLNTRLKVHAQVLVRLEQEPETQKKADFTMEIDLQ